MSAAWAKAIKELGGPPSAWTLEDKQKLFRAYIVAGDRQKRLKIAEMVWPYGIDTIPHGIDSKYDQIDTVYENDLLADLQDSDNVYAAAFEDFSKVSNAMLYRIFQILYAYWNARDEARPPSSRAPLDRSTDTVKLARSHPSICGVGLCELVNHLVMIDHIAVSGPVEGRVAEFVDHLLVVLGILQRVLDQVAEPFAGIDQKIGEDLDRALLVFRRFGMFEWQVEEDPLHFRHGLVLLQGETVLAEGVFGGSPHPALGWRATDWVGLVVFTLSFINA